MKLSCVRLMIILIFSFISVLALSQSDLVNYVNIQSSEQETPTLADWNGLQVTEQISAGFNCLGQLGLGYWPDWPYYDSSFHSFTSPPYCKNKYLNYGAIWVGGIVGQDTCVSVGHDGWFGHREFWPAGDPPFPTVQSFDYISDKAYRAEFFDTLTDIRYVRSIQQPWGTHAPLNLKIANRVHVWESAPYCNIYDMVITNIGDSEIEHGYVGLHIDPDIGNTDYKMTLHTDDLSGSIREHGIAMAYDNDGLPVSYQVPYLDLPHRRAFACKFLTTSFYALDTNFNWWTYYGQWDTWGPRLDSTPDDPYRSFGESCLGLCMGRPDGDENKYYVMSHKEWDYDQVWSGVQQDGWMPPQPIGTGLARGFDTYFLLSIGPFNLLPDSSIRLFYTTFTSNFIHVDPNNFADNFDQDDPSLYLSNLLFTDLIANGEIADSVSKQLLDETLPVTGLRVSYESKDSIIAEWDPWVFDNVDSYHIYVSEVDFENWPYDGVCPPWDKPKSLRQFTTTAKTYKYKFSGLKTDSIYFVNVAHNNGPMIGNSGEAILIKSFNKLEGRPIVEKTTVFGTEGGSAKLEWLIPDNVNYDYCRIYKFDNIDSAQNRYSRFYDKGENLRSITPRDSFEVDLDNYYYYAMEPYAVVDSGVSTFFDADANDENIYVVTSINKVGFESSFSHEITYNEILPRSKDILILMQRVKNNSDLIYEDTIVKFYDSVFNIQSGAYEYDFYFLDDTLKNCSVPGFYDCIDWKVFSRYRMLIFEDGLYESRSLFEFEELTKGLTWYIESGGSVCYFGLLGEAENRSISTQPAYYPVTGSFKSKYFGIDSVFVYGGFYNFPYLINDSLFGFIGAESIHGSLPGVYHDSTRCSMDTSIAINNPWPRNTGPRTATFKVNANGTTTHIYNSLYPGTSLIEGEPVGVMCQRETTSYLFGFHLWHMKHDEALALIDSMLHDNGTALSGDSEDDGDLLPDGFALSQNYPNPFNMSTTISFSIPRKSDVFLTVYNILGQNVRSVVSRSFSAGKHDIVWDGTDNSGITVASGVYFYRLNVGEFSQTRKMILLK